MILTCNSCNKKFVVPDSAITASGRMVQCGYCSVTWHQKPAAAIQTTEKLKLTKQTKSEIDDSPSVDSIKASDGKTYKFLGSQWAELLPSGKTGLFARKKISKELDEVTGRKELKITKKKRKTIEKMDPSEGLKTTRQQENLDSSQKGMGFLSYIFLVIIIAFSLVGILKTFEEDLIITFPEIQYLYDLLDEQLIYVSESVKNITVIIRDLLNSY